MNLKKYLKNIYFSYNIEGLLGKLIQNASNISDLIIKLYYPVGAYISLVNNYDIKASDFSSKELIEIDIPPLENLNVDIYTGA